MESRKQIKSLAPGDRVRLSIDASFEVVTLTDANNDSIALRVKPVPCGPECSPTCGCAHAFFEGAQGPFLAVRPSSQRLVYLGNLAELERQQQRLQEHIASLKGATRTDDAEQESTEHAPADAVQYTDP